jgi:hypothetical protein
MKIQEHFDMEQNFHICTQDEIHGAANWISVCLFLLFVKEEFSFLNS